MSDHAHQGGERFTIELEAMPSEVPPVIRLRRWLKAALRSAQFRALRVTDSTPKLPPLPTSADGAGGVSDA